MERKRVEFFVGADLRRRIPIDAILGLYVIRSREFPTSFRLGAAGIQKGKKGTIYKRLGNHASSPLRSTGNWTQYHRKWEPIWAAVIEDSSQLAVELCEKLLFSNFGQRFHFIPESGGSGFYVPPSEESAVLEIAETAQDPIVKILTMQSAACHRRVWHRGIHPDAYAETEC